MFLWRERTAEEKSSTFFSDRIGRSWLNDIAFFALGTTRGEARLGIIRYSQVFQGHGSVEEVVGHAGQLIAIEFPF